jgi:hypothetical protein
MSWGSHYLTSTRKEATEYILDHTIVKEEWEYEWTDRAIYFLVQKYCPIVQVEIWNSSELNNLQFKGLRLIYLTLREALHRICDTSEVMMDVNDEGALIFRPETVEEKTTRQATFNLVVQTAKRVTEHVPGR